MLLNVVVAASILAIALSVYAAATSRRRMQEARAPECPHYFRLRAGRAIYCCLGSEQHVWHEGHSRDGSFLVEWRSGAGDGGAS